LPGRDRPDSLPRDDAAPFTREVVVAEHRMLIDAVLGRSEQANRTSYRRAGKTSGGGKPRY
jgi:hypothetical protein